MVNVEVYVPYLNESYDFSLDESASVELVLDDIVSLICLKERWPLSQSSNRLDLFDLVHMTAISPKSTLLEAGVQSGQRLILC